MKVDIEILKEAKQHGILGRIPELMEVWRFENGNREPRNLCDLLKVME